MKQEISLERLQSIIGEAIQMGVKAISISGGEPLVRKDVETIVRQIADSNVVPVLLTNGCLLKWREPKASTKADCDISSSPWTGLCPRWDSQPGSHICQKSCSSSQIHYTFIGILSYKL